MSNLIGGLCLILHEGSLQYIYGIIESFHYFCVPVLFLLWLFFAVVVFSLFSSCLRVMFSNPMAL